MEQILIIGAGQAGFSAASTLRKEGFEGQITLIGDEGRLPYQRPPLSKKYLLGDMTFESLTFRDEGFFADESIDLVLDDPAKSIDKAARQVVLSSGKVLSYDKLILTMGSAARELPSSLGMDPERSFVIRSLADIDRLAPHFVAGKRILIVGGGYIGLETAAVAAQSGLTVTLLELETRLLARVTSEQTSAYFYDLHRGHSVDIRLETGLESIAWNEAHQVAKLTNGSELEFDLLVAGIGAVPNDLLARDAGLAVERGIVVDSRACTSDPHIFAAGDCCQFPLMGTQQRLESVQNAIEQAVVAAKSALGIEVDYAPMPWFWSDQFDVKLQIAGLSSGYDSVIKRSGRSEASCSHWYFKGDDLLCVEAMNDPRSYMMGKRWLEQKHSPDREKLADDSLDLRELK